jgi:predicted nucleic acid-binding protein
MRTFRNYEMPTRGDAPIVLVDTSVAVAVVVGDHEHHAEAVDALQDRRAGLAGHAAFEAFSVLTRLPAPARVGPRDVGRVLDANFPESRFLSARASAALLGELASQGISGGQVYDALVGAAALEHQLTLVTRDRRALATYRQLGVVVEMLP